jgi:DNA-binding transcriptional LysR family regulator
VTSPGAARELQVDNSTISRRLAALEEAVGAKLLIRGGREFSWTAEGRTLIAAGEAMEASTMLAMRAMRTAKVDVDGTGSGIGRAGLRALLMRLMLPALRDAHPTLRVELDGGFQLVDLARGDADISSRMAPPEEPDLVACHVVDCAWFACAAASCPEARGCPATFDDPAQHELVLYTEAVHRVPPLRWIEAYRGTACELSRVDKIACQTISAGRGIAVLPCFIAGPAPGLRRVFPDRVAVNPGWIVYQEAARDAPRVRVVADAPVECFRSHEPIFAGGAAQGTGTLRQAVLQSFR